MKFTTRPKDREVFVGKDVQLDWGYENDDGNNKVETVQFGVKIGPNEIAFVNKDVQSGMLTWGPESKFPKVESFKKKTKVVLNSADKEWKASIVISQLAMNDTGFIFCKLKGQDPSQRQPSESVFLKVVGKWGFFICFCMHVRVKTETAIYSGFSSELMVLMQAWVKGVNLYKQ